MELFWKNSCIFKALKYCCKKLYHSYLTWFNDLVFDCYGMVVLMLLLKKKISALLFLPWHFNTIGIFSFNFTTATGVTNFITGNACLIKRRVYWKLRESTLHTFQRGQTDIKIILSLIIIKNFHYLKTSDWTQ